MPALLDWLRRKKLTGPHKNETDTRTQQGNAEQQLRGDTLERCSNVAMSTSEDLCKPGFGNVGLEGGAYAMLWMPGMLRSFTPVFRVQGLGCAGWET